MADNLIADILSLKSVVTPSGYPNLYSISVGADSLTTISTAGYLNAAIDTLKTGDRVHIRTSDDAIAYAATVRNDGTNVYLDFDRTLFFETQMSDISANTTSWITMPPAGVITQVYAVKWSAITVASAVITFSLGSTAITTGVVTVTVAGDPGSKYSATPTALNIADGSTAVKAVSGGESTDTAIATVGFKIICPQRV